MRVLRILGATLLVCAATTASAQTPFRHSGAESKHGAYSLLPGEHLDSASGTLSLVATDLVLPETPASTCARRAFLEQR